MRPTLRQLEYLVSVAENGSFSRAAKELGVTQPALSAQFAEMEAYLGAPLIERSPKGIFLTHVGQIALQHAKAILQDTREFRLAVKNATEPFSGLLKLGVLPSIGAYFLPLLTRRLHKKYPKLRFQIWENGAAHLTSALISGEHDVIFSEDSDHPALDSTHLFTESLWICAAVDDELMSSDTPVGIDALKDKTLISLGSESGFNQTIQKLAKLARANVSHEYRGGSLDASRQLAVMGAGVAVLPSLYALNEARRDPNFIVRRIDHPDAFQAISLSWRKSTPHSEMFTRFAEDVIEIKSKFMQDMF